MRKLILLLPLVLGLGFATPLLPPAGAAITYRAGEGWTPEDEDSGAVEKTASAQALKAQTLEANGELKKAIGAYRAVVRLYPETAVAANAQFKIAGLLEKAELFERAFEAYGKYISTYPRGEEFESAVEGQFRIATAFLNGQRRIVFGVKTFSSMDRAHDMFEEIVKNAPYSKWAALSEFNVGQALEKKGSTLESVAAYQTVVDKYPADEIAGDALYQIGYVYLKLAKEGSNDQSARTKAREAFEDFLMRFPNSEKAAQATANLKLLEGTDVKKTLDIADFYRRTKNNKAAVIYYEEVRKMAPGSPEAETASKQIATLKKEVGEEALRSGPERAETGSKAEERRKLQSQVDTASRPDYAGPPAPQVVPDEVAPEKPKLRTSNPAEAGPLPPGTEPSLPSR